MKGFLLRMPKKAMVAAVGLIMLGVAAVATVGGTQMALSHQDSVRIPIVMYHHILEDSRLLGDYVISPGQLESDLQYIRDQGYTAVLPREVAAWVRGEGDLPEKPIMITFDDGNKSAYVYAYPLLKKYGMKGVLSVIGIHSEKYSGIDDGNVNYAHTTWAELGELAQSGIFEIGNHTYDMHEESSPRAGIRRCADENARDYRETLGKDLAMNQGLLEAATGGPPKVFAYPYGFVESDANGVLDELGFDVTLGVEEKVSAITCGDMDSLKCLGRFNRPYAATTNTFFEKIKRKSE